MSAGLRLPRDQLAALRPEDLQLYLSSRGWVAESTPPSSKAIFYRLPGQKNAEVLLPRQRDIADYVSRMGDILEMLTAVEQRPVGEVLRDISGPPADVIRLGVTTPEATLGTLPLEEGVQLVKGGCEMLVAAACSVRSPQAFYPRQSFREVTEFLKECRLGQTERGSFVATIITPVPPLIEAQSPLPGMEDTQFQTEPFARRVTLRLMSSLRFVSTAIETAAHQKILEGVAEGVSSNLCQAIATMRPSGDQSRLQVRMSWARTRPNVPRNLPHNVSFSQAAFPIIEEAGRHLRERQAPRVEQIKGYVVGLRAETALLEGFEGKVTLLATIEGSTVHVRVILGKDDYAKACNAHRDARLVAVRGQLHRELKFFELLGPHDFQILGDGQ